MRGSITMEVGRRAARVAHGLLEDVLGVVLDLAVEREAHVLAGRRLLVRHGLEGVAGRIAHDGLAAGLARELLVVEQLDAREALVLRAGEAEDLGRRALERVHPLLLGVAHHAREVERERRLGELGVDLARHVGEPVLLLLAGDQRVRDVPASLAAVDLQRVAQLVRRGARVDQEMGIAKTVCCGLPTASSSPFLSRIEPRCAGSTTVYGLLLLGDLGEVLRRRGERDGFAADEHEEDDEHEAEEADAPVDAAPGGLRGSRRGRRRAGRPGDDVLSREPPSAVRRDLGEGPARERLRVRASASASTRPSSFSAMWRMRTVRAQLGDLLPQLARSRRSRGAPRARSRPSAGSSARRRS